MFPHNMSLGKWWEDIAHAKGEETLVAVSRVSLEELEGEEAIEKCMRMAAGGSISFLSHSFDFSFFRMIEKLVCSFTSILLPLLPKQPLLVSTSPTHRPMSEVEG